ncbi:cation-transporting ATPase [Aurantimicrobium minutum]|uniref:Cation-transporting ATPase n=1 Tax=Aurantimicrobium minutum TaxID=708131 RepID=A0A173LXX6_9MICO|nr:cation-transporting ATPase [Aurantimicrobium minutum]
MVPFTEGSYTVNKHKTQKYRISITTTTVEDLEKLRYAFEGNMAHGEHQDCSDDVLVAALLGWHFRQIQVGGHWFAKSLLHEFNIRQQLLLDPAKSWVDEELRRERDFFRGSPSTPGNILTLDGIDLYTLQRVEARVQAVKMMVNKLNEDHGHDAHRRLRYYSDQAIIDLGLWWTLTQTHFGEVEVEDFPFWVKDEIVARAQARQDVEGGTLVPDAMELPPLSPSERVTFFRSRRISNRDRFWTDDRIRAAMEMGL